MLFIFGSLVLVIITILLSKKVGIENPFSKGIALAVALSIVAVICLSQNYTQSLIPEANDGIGISNILAYWIIGEERWSIEMFKKLFERSTYITILLIITYPIVLVVESKMNRKPA